MKLDITRLASLPSCSHRREYDDVGQGGKVGDLPGLAINDLPEKAAGALEVAGTSSRRWAVELQGSLSWKRIF